MRHQSDNLTNLLNPVVTGLGYELVGAELLPQRRGSLLRLYIDAEKGITLKDCQTVSRQIEGVLDVEDPISGEYTLEVSSPGLDRPLFTLEHFEHFCGSQVKLSLSGLFEGRRKISGLLKAVEGNEIIVLEQEQEFRIPFSQIDKARLIA